MKIQKTTFEIYMDAKGEYRWRMIVTNGKIVADSSEGYTEKTSCRKAVRRLVERLKNGEIVIESLV